MNNLRRRIRRLSEKLVRPITADDYCRAIRAWQEDGTKPIDQKLRDYIDAIEDLTIEFDELHVLEEPTASSSSPESTGDGHDGGPREGSRRPPVCSVPGSP